MATTPNMNIPYPASSDYVADGATAMENIADQVDSKTGLVHIHTENIPTSGTLPTSVTINDCFSSTFDDYRIMLSGIESSTSASLLLQLTASGTPNAVSYYWATAYVTFSTGALTSASGASPRTNWIIAGNNSTAYRWVAFVDLFAPYINTRTSMTSTAYNSRDDIASIGTSGFHTVPGVWDGVKIATDTGTMKGGSIRVYGYSHG